MLFIMLFKLLFVAYFRELFVRGLLSLRDFFVCLNSFEDASYVNLVQFSSFVPRRDYLVLHY